MLIERQVELTPQSIAVLDDDYEITYAELNARANQLANYIRSKFGGPGTTIAISMDRSPELVASVLAILKAGAACAPIDASYPADRRAFMLKESAAVAILTTSDLRAIFDEAALPVIAVDTQWLEIDCEPEGNLQSITKPTDPCYIIFTSGSTGVPKGVVMPHGPIVNLAWWHLHAPEAPGRLMDGRNRSARTLQFAPITFDVSFQEILTTWAGGGTLVLLTDKLRLDPEALLRHIVEYNVQRLYLPVVVLVQLAETVAAGSRLPNSLDDVITAGESLRITPDVAAFFAALPHCSLHNHYGPSETHVVTAHKLSGPSALWPVFPPIGRPIWNTLTRILDGLGNDVEPGDEGELYLGGDCLADGYANRPDLTSERFVPLGSSPLNEEGARFYKTGDRVLVNADGDLEYLGRIDQQIKIRGYRVEPGEIEEALGRNLSVSQAVVVAKTFDNSDKILVAYIVPAAGFSISSVELRSDLRKTLPDYMIPAHYLELPSLPLTSSGKVDRKSLADRPLAPLETAAAQQYNDSGSRVEDVLANLWRSHLHLTDIGFDDNFFEIGGNSIQAVRLHRSLRERFDHEFPITILFELPTINLLAKFLRKSIKNPESADDLLSPASAGDPMEQIRRLRAYRKR